MTQNYGFKDIYAVQYNLAKPNRVQLQGLKPYSQITKSLDKDIKQIPKIEKAKAKMIKKEKLNTQRKFDNSINSLFGRSSLFK